MWKLTVERRYETEFCTMTETMAFESESMPELIDLISKLEELTVDTLKYIIEAKGEQQ